MWFLKYISTIGKTLVNFFENKYSRYTNVHTLDTHKSGWYIPTRVRRSGCKKQNSQISLESIVLRTFRTTIFREFQPFLLVF